MLINNDDGDDDDDAKTAHPPPDALAGIGRAGIARDWQKWKQVKRNIILLIAGVKGSELLLIAEVQSK